MKTVDEFDLLALEQTPSRSQRLFAAEDTSIKVRLSTCEAVYLLLAQIYHPKQIFVLHSRHYVI